MQSLEDVALSFDEQFRRASVRNARASAVRYSVDCLLPDDATCDDVRKFIADEVMPVVDEEVAKVEEIYRLDPSLKLNSSQRLRLHEKYPRFHRATADDVLAAVRIGRRGESAIRLALRRITRPAPRTPAHRSARARKARSAARARTRAPNGDGKPRPRLLDGGRDLVTVRRTPERR